MLHSRSLSATFTLLATSLALAADAPNASILTNGDFSGPVTAGIPAGWIWGSSSPKAKVSCRVVDDATRPNGKAVKITSNQPKEPNVYGSLSVELQNIEPMTEYRFSFDVRTHESSGEFWYGGGRDWRWHMGLPSGTSNWQRIDNYYRTGPDETTFKFIFGAEGKGTVWIRNVAITRIGRSSDPTIKPPVAAQSREQILAALKPIRDKQATWHKQIDALRAAGAVTDQAEIKLALIDSFIIRIDERVKDDKYLLPCTVMITELPTVASGLDADIAAITADPNAFPPTPRYRTGKISIDGTTQLADVFDPTTGKTSTQPVVFSGYGNFFSVADEVATWPARGCNVIAIEQGPNGVISADASGKLVVDEKPIDNIVRQLNDAAKANVAVVLLVSPHYMPNCGNGQWNSDTPGVINVLTTYMQHLIPKVKDIPSLHSIILSNEPHLAVEPKDTLYVAGWHKYLRDKYATLDALNRTHGRTYASFDAVPLPDTKPGPSGYPSNTSVGSHPKKDRPWYADWLTYHDQRFANWHKRLADTIHAIAPNLPVHTKFTAGSLMASGLGDQTFIGIDPEMIADFTQYNGYDDVGGLRIVNDLLPALHAVPAINSENHLLNPDGCYDTLNPQAFYADLFIQTMHGQFVSTVWTYEPKCEPMSLWDFSIRPLQMDALGRVSLDLMRTAPALAAIQKAPKHVAVIYSPTSFAYNEDYHPTWRTAWEAFSSTGLRVGFLSERQLQAGQFGDTKVLILPEATVVESATLAALKKFTDAGGKLIVVGKALQYTPSWTPIDAQSLNLPIAATLNRFNPFWPMQLVGAVAKCGVAPSLALTFANGTAPIGIHWLPGTLNGRPVVAAVNLTGKPASLKLTLPKAKSSSTNVTDLITQRHVSQPISLAPLGATVLRIDE